MYKLVTKENMDEEHICCAISNKDSGVLLKKSWLKKQMDNGLVFRKLDERGKIFIEYLPAEFAYAPVTADDCMYINCFWVSGKYKKQGHGKALLDYCVEDATSKGKNGVVVLSSKKKKPFLSDPSYLKAYGFTVVDSALDYELLYYPIKESDKPRFNESVGHTEGNKLYYSHQCPHTEKYVGLIKDLADNEGFPLEVILIDSVKAAKRVPCPFTTYSLYLEGQFVTNEILTEKKFLEMIKPLQ